MGVADKTLPPQLRATGRAMIHCHNNDHADFMMMLTMLVNPDMNAKPGGVGLVPGPQSDTILQIVKQSACL
jgi:FtsP/CotA-like multicopper oxidase with cupredoxin domain